MAAGNKREYTYCNYIDDKGTVKPFSETILPKTVFFVGDITYTKDGPAQLSSCYPVEGEADTQYLVVSAGGYGSSFAALQVAGVFALLMSRWPYYEMHAHKLGTLVTETADLIPVTYTPARKADGSVITSRSAVTQRLRRPNVQRALAMDRVRCAYAFP
ncbi:MAG: hypothetical protein LBD66_00490 [Holosporales bacterium]|jgi:subtilisin family serine protease|nr:hypothetical protein [Holosporales bacterium]